MQNTAKSFDYKFDFIFFTNINRILIEKQNNYKLESCISRLENYPKDSPKDNKQFVELLQMGGEFYKINRLHKAEKCFFKALEYRPKYKFTLDGLYKVARKHYINCDIDLAVDCCKEILKHDSKHELSYDFLCECAESYSKDSNLGGAAECFRILLNNDKGFLSAKKIGLMGLSIVAEKYLNQESYLAAGKLAVEVIKSTNSKSKDDDIKSQNINANRIYNSSIEGLKDQGNNLSKLILEEMDREEVNTPKKRKLRGGKKIVNQI